MKDREIAIKVESISKCYRIGMKEELKDSFATSIFSFMKSPVNNYRKYRSLYKFDDIKPNRDGFMNNNPSDIIWVLKDVSFEVKQGEVVGIIGLNGAGKSTLLKILTRITEPTRGRGIIRGRVSSLLEVGTGFHRELTGRENVYLNGTILGMKKKEVDRAFDEIVDFSGVEKFIDTPVKRYSSGMRLRLAFAVAAHLEPEILLIDEVLAVGDARFQKKCLEKMQDISQHGRTILFVSHNMPAITRLCSRSILLDQGVVLADGPSNQVVSTYLNAGQGSMAERKWPDASQAPGGEIVRLRAMRVKNEDGQVTDVIDIRKPVGIEMEYEVLKSGYVLLPHYYFFNGEGIKAFTSMDNDPNWRKRHRPAGRYVSTAWIPGNLLSEGTMYVEPVILTLEPLIKQAYAKNAVAFQVVDNHDGDSARADWVGKLSGVIRPMLKWDTEYVPNELNTTSDATIQASS